MKLRHAAALALVGWYLMMPVGSARGQGPGCDRQSEMRADAEADGLKTWQDIHQSYLRYRQCDDGGIWEGYSDSVVTTLAKRWDQLPSLQILIAHDDIFREFIFRHIDATTSPEDLVTVARNAKRKCPTWLADLCADLSRRAQEAEAEMPPTPGHCMRTGDPCNLAKPSACCSGICVSGSAGALSKCGPTS